MVENIKQEPLGNGFFVNVSRHHAFGTDAIVLANFAKPKKTENYVDLGTGCGIIPLIILRDNPKINAIGVDISEEATFLAQKTVNDLNLSNFTVINSNLLNLKGKVEFGSKTLITCNPPYKAPNAGLKNPDQIDMVARHEVACTLEDIVSVSARLLQSGGRLCMCQRPERLAEMMCLFSKYKIEPKRLRLVSQRKGEAPWLVLLEGRRSGKVGLVIEPTLYVEENGALTPEMIELYGSYKEDYLK